MSELENGSGTTRQDGDERQTNFTISGQLGVRGENAPSHISGIVFDPKSICAPEYIRFLVEKYPHFLLDGDETTEELFPEILHALPIDKLPSDIVLLDRDIGNEIDRIASTGKVRALLSQSGILSHGMVSLRETIAGLHDFVGVGRVDTPLLAHGDCVLLEIGDGGNTTIEVTRSV